MHRASRKLILDQALISSKLPAPWEIVLVDSRPSKLRATFVFEDFPSAFSFMTKTAFVAEKLNHHPDWKNSYNTVHVDLSTHDQGGITELDLRLALQMSAFSALLNPPKPSSP